MGRFFVMLVTLVIRGVVVICRSRAQLALENLALRQQVTALKQRRPRPPLDDADRGFWVALRACWPGWVSRLVLVKPDTVVKWHQQRFRRYHDDRTHLGLGKDTPTGRLVAPQPSPMAQVVALPRVGGLHHRYQWRNAA